MNKVLSTVIRLRRDNDYVYETIKNTFVPASGEVCLVDTSTHGLRAKVGDGVTTFANLQFSDEDIRAEINGLIVHGYYYNEEFYYDVEHTQKVIPNSVSIYTDKFNHKLYVYSAEQKYECMIDHLPNATAQIAGIMKLYSETGQNTDGTMTQKAITNELDNKFEISIDEEDETIEFI